MYATGTRLHSEQQATYRQDLFHYAFMIIWGEKPHLNIKSE